MKIMNYAEALVDGLYEALASDDRVTIVSGHPVGFGPHRSLMDRVYDKFHDRIFDPPNSEAAIAGMGAGAAMLGDRPFINLSTSVFSYVGWSQIVNDAPNVHHMSNGMLCAPVVYYGLHGARGNGAAQHSGSPQAMLWNAPGLQIALPASPSDAKGLLLSAFRSKNPTFFLTHAKLLGVEGPVQEGIYETPFGQADIKRSGRDVTMISTSLMVIYALQAAETLATEGIEVEVVDPRTLTPFDEKTLLESVERTGRLVVVDECPLRCGVAAEITTTIAEKGFKFLKAAPVRITRPDVPIPFSTPIEDEHVPDATKIADAVRRLMH